jgi:hypothetical protein
MRRLSILVVALFSVMPIPAQPLAFTSTYIDNSFGDFAARGWLDPSSIFQRNVSVAFDIWGGMVDSDANLSVRVIADRGQARLGAQYSNGFQIGIDGPGGFNTGYPIYEPGPISKIRTGVNPANQFGESDIMVQVNASFVSSNYWLDPTPTDRTEPGHPSRTEFIWVMLHEIGHALGMISNRIKRPAVAPGDPEQGSFFANYLSLFDTFTFFGGTGTLFDASGQPNPFFFDGPLAMEVNGGAPVPLLFISESANTSGPNAGLAGGNFDHLGSCTGPAYLSLALMRACYSPVGPTRYGITEIDLAILADLGIPMVATDDPAQVLEPASIVLLASVLAVYGALRSRRGRGTCRVVVAWTGLAGRHKPLPNA